MPLDSWHPYHKYAFITLLEGSIEHGRAKLQSCGLLMMAGLRKTGMLS